MVRDVKPENILLDAKGHVVMTDFGVSKGNCKLRKDLAQSFTGTVEYMAPEQMTGLPYSYSVDWYSLGLVILEMLTGYQPLRITPRPPDFVLS